MCGEREGQKGRMENEKGARKVDVDERNANGRKGSNDGGKKGMKRGGSEK